MGKYKEIEIGNKREMELTKAELKRYDCEDVYEFVTKSIPNATYYYEYSFTKRNVNEGRKYGLKMEAEGKTLFTIIHNSSIVHFIAFDKKHISIWEELKPYLDSDYFLQRFKAADLVYGG